MSEERDISLKTAIRRAVLHRCPACGEGKLFKSYLSQVENCAACGERFGHIRADDAAPWGTIILVGHVFLPLAFMVDVDFLSDLGGDDAVGQLLLPAVAGGPAAIQGPVPRDPLAHPRAGLQAGRDRLARTSVDLFQIAGLSVPFSFATGIRVG